KDCGPAVRGPRDAGVVEDAGLDRQDSVVAAATQQTERWEPELEVGHRDAAAPELIEHRARGAGRVAALSGREAVVVVTADQARVSDKHRIETRIFRVLSIPSDVEDTRADRERPDWHHILSKIGQGRDVLQIPERRGHLEPPAIAEDRAGG